MSYKDKDRQREAVKAAMQRYHKRKRKQGITKTDSSVIPGPLTGIPVIFLTRPSTSTVIPGTFVPMIFETRPSTKHTEPLTKEMQLSRKGLRQ